MPESIISVQKKTICGLKYPYPYHKIDRPIDGKCSNSTRVCGGSKPLNQYCIEKQFMCPVNDLQLADISESDDDYNMF
jgi:hypothetical protein